VTVGQQVATHELLRTSPYATGTAILQRQILSARTGRLLRETQQDGDGTAIAFICHQYDSLGRGLQSSTYPFDENAFTSGDVSRLEPTQTQTMHYTEDDRGKLVRDCDAEGRHQQCYYDGLQRIVRRELQRQPGNDHRPVNYCVIEETHSGADGQVAYDYLPGGLRIDHIKALPQQSKGWFWQGKGDGHEAVITDAQKNESLTTSSRLGLFSKGELTSQRSTQRNNADGSVTLTQDVWEGADQPAVDPAISTTETINKKGQRERLAERIPGYAKQDRQWDIAYDELGRQVSVTKPDKSIVTWAYQGLSEVPISVSVKASATAKAKVLASRTLDNDAVTTVVRGSDPDQTFKARQGGWEKPDGTALYQEQNTDGSVSWYAKNSSGTATPLVTFKLSAVTRALQAERPVQGSYQSLVTSETLQPLLLGNWRFNRTVHGQEQREEGLASLRGMPSGEWHSNGLPVQAWANTQGYRSRLRRGSLEYHYEYSALGQVTVITVEDMRSGQHLRVDYSYDGFGRETERSYHLNRQAKVCYAQTWSAANQLLTKTLFRDGRQVRGETFTYNTSVKGTSDELQKWTVMAESGEEVKDEEGCAIEEQSYEYDVLGNLTKCATQRKNNGTLETLVRTYEYGDQKHPTRRTKITWSNKTSAVTLSYDRNGNLLTNEREQTLAYTDSGRLRSVTAKGAATPLTYYEYDEHDRLIAQWDAASNKRRILNYAGNDQSGETWQDNAGNVLKRQVLDAEAGLVVALDDQWIFVLGDPQNGGGDEYQFKDGNWQRRSIAFTPWGETHLPSLKAQHVGVGYNGQRVDPVTGGYHLGNGYRLYDPAHKVFYQADDWSPLGAGGLNDRAYCASGDPVNYHDPSGHIMLSRHAQADNLARMDDFLKTLTSNGKAPPEAATPGEWVFFGVMTIVGAIAIVASAGTLGPLVAGLLMAAYVGGAAITATGMALRQKDPALSATLEPVGQVVMALASVPAIGSRMAGVAKWVTYGWTLAYAGLEIARVSVQRSNPELAEKLGWAAMAASLMDLAFAGMMKFARSMFRVGQKALTALRALRNKVKLHVISSLQRTGRRSRYLLDTRLQTGTAQAKTRWRDVELGGVRSNGRVMQTRVDLPGIHLFDDQVGFKHAITENNRLMGAFLDRELAQLRSARKAQLNSRSAIAYERSLDETRLGLKKLTTESTNLTAAKDKFKATEKEYRSVKSATDEMDDLLSGKNNKGISLDRIKAANTDDFAAEFLDFEYKYSDHHFSGVTSIIEAAQKKAGVNLANSLSASDWKRYATTLRSSLKTRHAKLETAHNAALEHIKKLQSNFSKNFKLHKDKTLATLNQTHASYRSHLASSPKGKSFIPADIPQHIAPKSRLNVISHGYTNHDSSEISQVVRYELKDGKLTKFRTDPEKFYGMLIEDFKSNMKNSPHELKKLTKTSYQSITKREWQELFKKKYASIRLLSCNLALEVGGTSYTQQLSQLAGIPIKGSTHRLLATISDSHTLLKEFRSKQVLRGLEGTFSDFFNSSLALPRHKLHVPKLDMPGYYRSPTYERGTLVFHDVGYNYQMTTVTPGG